MPADLSKPFAESCCDGGQCGLDDKSTQPCGCDKGANWVCEQHREDAMRDTVPAVGWAERTLAGVIAPSGDQCGMSSMTPGFVIKDSGKREQFSGGMVRDTADGKIDYTLIRKGPMFERWAEHLRKGAAKYGKHNWLKGEGQVELDRAYESASRHFEQWMRGDIDEDHAAAIFFNVNQVEYLKLKMKEPG